MGPKLPADPGVSPDLVYMDTHFGAGTNTKRLRVTGDAISPLVLLVDVENQYDGVASEVSGSSAKDSRRGLDPSRVLWVATFRLKRGLRCFKRSRRPGRQRCHAL